jgi:hypothetical protein
MIMRRLLIITSLLVCCAFACKKAKGPANGKSVQPNNNLDSNVSINATINGYPWQTDSAFGYNVKHSGNDSGVSNLMITATNTNNGRVSSMVFNITNFTGPSAYTINPPINTATYYIGNIRHYATHGLIIITSDTAYALKGSFYFTADTITVSDGNFNVALP